MKHQFKDTEGQLWTLAITVREYMAIKSEHGIDIGNIFDEKTSWIQDIIAQDNMEVFLGVLGCLTDKEREARDMSMEDFYGLLGGDVLEGAANAVIEAIVNFTPAHRRGALKKIVSSTEIALATVGEKVEALMDKEMEELSGKIDEMMS